MPQRHSKNNNDLAFFTYDEKRKLGYGTQKERLGKDSIKPFDACSLCLKPLIDPLSCLKGHVFCKECILECLLSQKKDIQRRLAAHAAQQKQEKEEQEEKLMLQKARELDAFDQQNHGAVPQYNDRNLCQDKNGFHGANSVKVTSYEEEALRTMKAFWLPSATPEAPVKVEAPSISTVCPQGNEKLKLKTLFPIYFTEDTNDQKKSNLSTFEQAEGRPSAGAIWSELLSQFDYRAKKRKSCFASGNGNLRDKCDPIFQTRWMFLGVLRDILLLENQLHFLFFTKLVEMTWCPSEPHDLIHLALYFFDGLTFPWPLCFSQSSYNSIQNIEHLLSLVHRAAFSSIVEIEMAGKAVLTIKELKSMPFATRKDLTSMPCATELQEAGIKFKILEGGNNLINIKFTNGIMEIPPLFIRDITEAFLHNLVAYEQYNRDKDLRVTDYVMFMDCLIKSPKDVEVLRRQGIVNNYMGDDGAVSTMFNKLVNYVSTNKIFYAEIYRNVNKHCRKRRNIWMAKLRRDYFHSPWALLSFLAAIFLLLLSSAQTIFSILSYIFHKS
ncbi:hypothetical protein CJ030_MR0G022775 [Morella rubra]|uniref:Nitric oxide synthase-interacting protein zinc-finger domain-containing protein n=1 Tax=Morella rubra TaxID=262757 RepID=A0A6A1UGV0_9ROSI|nr:hypothetical protein CJ030_MR0G022775 [Morella rubra]